MIRMKDTGRRVVRSLGLAAAALLVLTMVPGERAQAMSPINPGAQLPVNSTPDVITVQFHGHGGGGGGPRGGGGGFHGGGGGGFHGGGGAAFHGGGGGAAFHAAPAFHGGGGGGGFRAGPAFHGGGVAAFHGGGFRAGPAFHGGGVRYGGGYHRGFAYRPHFHHRHVYGYGYGYEPDYYPAYTSYYYPHRRCRVIWTHYGPRRVCHYRPWHRPHHWRHRHHRHHRYW